MELSRSYGAVMAQLWRSYRRMLVRGVLLDDEDVSCGCRRELVCEFRLRSRARITQILWDACACAHRHVLHDLEHVSRGFEHMV